MYWVNESIFYQIYPMGFTNAPRVNDGKLEYRLDKVIDFIPHLKKLNINAIYFSPVFMSTTHGYDTDDYMKIDNRLGDNESFKKICDALHENGIKVVLDGVFNHVGRNFWAFRDVREKGSASPYCSWFQNLHFGGGSPYGDPFSYEGWQGHYDLVKLNLRNPDVKQHLLDAVGMWMDTFKIDGLRLDAADCVDLDFFKALRHYTKSKDPNFWLFGEIIHGDYNRWANAETLDSVTNYECYKGIYSAHNSKNYFEIAHSLNRQFGNGGIYRNIYTYNFVDNHDVNRVASVVQRQEYLPNIYSTLYFMPGVPSVYYGSEWGLQGQKNNVDHDWPLRPCLNVSNIKENDLFRHICKLGAIRRSFKALKYGSFDNVIIRNEQLIFKRRFEDETVYIALNLTDNTFNIGFNTDGGRALFDVMNGNQRFDVSNNYANIDIPAHGTRVLVLTNGTAPVVDLGEESIPAPTAETAKTSEAVVSEPKPAAKPEPQLPARGTPGRYRHYKGGIYEFIAIAKHSETMEDLVIYKETWGEGKIWARPASMFYQFVNVGDKQVPRFEHI